MKTLNGATLFIFHLIDDGLSKNTLSDYDPLRLAIAAEAAISGYLAEHGYGDDEDEELKTDDGYAKIVLSVPGDPEAGNDIWSYSFDGEVSLPYAFQELRERINMLELPSP